MCGELILTFLLTEWIFEDRFCAMQIRVLTWSENSRALPASRIRQLLNNNRNYQNNMITKTQLKADKDEQNRVKYQFDMPWDETSLSRLYDKMDAAIEGGSLVDIVSVVPISFDKDKNTIKVEVTLDLSDLFEETSDQDEIEEEEA